MPTPPSSALDSKARVENYNTIYQQVVDEVHTESKEKAKKKKRKLDNRIYNWRHYYTRPKWKDFEPDSKLADKLESAPPPPPRRFKDVTPGEMVLKLLREAHARGALTDIRANFSKERDSAGRPWGKKPKDLIHHKFKPKTTLLEVVRWLAESNHAEARMNGRILELYQPDSGEFHADVLLAPGKNIIEQPTKASHRDRASHVFVISESGVHGWVGDQNIRKKIGRRVEAGLDIGPVKHWEGAEERGKHYLKRHGNPKHARIVKIVPDTGANPYHGKYKIGDEILLMENGATARHRVRQVAINWETDGSAEINLVLSDKLIHKDVKAHRRMRSLTGKTAMTSPALSQLSGSETPTSDGEAPDPPSTPDSTVRNGIAEIRWDGLDDSGAIPVWDQDHVEVHIGIVEGFVPGELTYHSSLRTAGSVTVNFPDYDTPYYIKLVAVDQGGDASAPSEEIVVRVPKVTSDDIQPGAVGSEQLDPDIGIGTDGNVPPSAPANVRTIAAKDGIFVLWEAVVNADPVTYNVYCSDTSGFTADATTLLTPTGANSPIMFRALPNGLPFEYFVYDPVAGAYTEEVKQYYFKVEVRDADVAPLSLGPISAEVTGHKDQTQGGDIAFNSIIGQHLYGEVILGGVIATALAGAGIRLSPEAFGIYKSDDGAKLYAPTNDEPMLINGEVIAQALTVLGRMNVFGSDNTVEPGGILTLKGSTQAPQTAPTASGNNWAQTTLAEDDFPEFKRGLQHVVASYTVTNKALASNVATLTIGTHNLQVGHSITVTGVDATFNGTFTVTARTSTTVSYAKTASNVAFTASGGNVTGSMHDHYFFGMSLGWSGNDPLGSTINEYDTSGNHIASYPILDFTSDPADVQGGITKIGSEWYALTYWKPDDEWWVYKYSTPLSIVNNAPVAAWQYTNDPDGDLPCIGDDGTNVIIARTNATANEIKIRKFNPTTGAAGSVYTSNFAVAGGGADLAAVMQVTADFGTGTNQFVVCPRSAGTFNENWWVLQGPTDGSPGNERPNSEWPVAYSHEVGGACYNTILGQFVHVTRDISQGKLVKYSKNFWSTESSVWWVVNTIFDSVGTQHETGPSPKRKLTMTKRGQLAVTTGSIPGAGGADDPNSMRIYVGRGSSAPTDANMFLSPQQPGIGQTFVNITSQTFSGTSLTSKATDFVAAVASKIQDEGLQKLLASDGSTGVFYTGDVKPTFRDVAGGGTIIDGGWFKADNTQVSRTTEVNLWTAIGSPDDGDGNTTYNLPDGRGRTLFGAGSDVALLATDGKAAGSRGPVHTHGMGHTHGISNVGHVGDNTASGFSNTGGGLLVVHTIAGNNSGNHNHGGDTLGASSTSTANSASDSIGYIGANWLIKR